MKCEEEIPTELLNETQAARYIGESPEYLRRRRTELKSKHWPPCPPFVHTPVTQAVLYRKEDLKSWLECYEPSREAAEKKYERACRLGQAKGLVPNKTFRDLLVDLETWLATHRPDFWEGFNDPASEDQLDQFEKSTGLILPMEYRLLMSWRDGHKNQHWKILDPFEKQGFLSLGHTESSIECLNGLLDKGSIDEKHWRRDWLPFMGDIFGNHLCIDLSRRNYGRVFFWNHEGEGWDVSKDLATWLEELVGRLQFLNVQVWEREFLS